MEGPKAPVLIVQFDELVHRIVLDPLLPEDERRFLSRVFNVGYRKARLRGRRPWADPCREADQKKRKTDR
jgi:hypothetical protein